MIAILIYWTVITITDFRTMTIDIKAKGWHFSKGNSCMVHSEEKRVESSIFHVEYVMGWVSKLNLRTSSIFQEKYENTRYLKLFMTVTHA